MISSKNTPIFTRHYTYVMTAKYFLAGLPVGRQEITPE